MKLLNPSELLSVAAKATTPVKQNCRRPIFKRAPVNHKQAPAKTYNEANLLKLADYLASLPSDYEQFEMGVFMSSKQFGSHKPKPALLTDCGTVACAVGHGPSAGIESISGEDWHEYAGRVFTFHGLADTWLFSGGWSVRDNTAAGAASRIYYFLQHGVPINGRYGNVYVEVDPTIYASSQITGYV